MPLKYALFENPVTADPKDRMAVVQLNTTYTLDHVAQEMLSRGSTVTKAEMLSVLEEYMLAIEKLIEQGEGSITTPLFNITLSVAGVFNSDEDSFDPSRHQVKIRINPGVRLREIERKIKTQRVVAERPGPVLLSFLDHTTESRNEVGTPGGGAILQGSTLKFDEADPKQGIFFVQAGGATTRVSERLLRNKPGELIFMVPDKLPKGTYQVEVRVKLPTTKDIRTGILPYDLTVA